MQQLRIIDRCRYVVCWMVKFQLKGRELSGVVCIPSSMKFKKARQGMRDGSHVQLLA